MVVHFFCATLYIVATDILKLELKTYFMLNMWHFEAIKTAVVQMV